MAASEQAAHLMIDLSGPNLWRINSYWTLDCTASEEFKVLLWYAIWVCVIDLSYDVIILDHHLNMQLKSCALNENSSMSTKMTCKIKEVSMKIFQFTLWKVLWNIHEIHSKFWSVVKRRKIKKLSKDEFFRKKIYLQEIL